ncbi:DUF11 domain-containing protein [Candidatus Acetothermia bacterium]|nr:DUF11 domain-containing protein [Candidatus Acetothermia bacterium]
MSFFLRSLLFPLCLFHIVAASAWPAVASSLVRLGDAELEAYADLIVDGTVLKTESKWNDAHTIIVTYTTIGVAGYIKGSGAGTVVVQTPGGIVGNVGIAWFGMPTFTQGEQVKLYLSDRNGIKSVLGAWQGKREIADLPIGDASPSTPARPQWEQLNAKDTPGRNVGLHLADKTITLRLEADGDSKNAGTAALGAIRNSFSQVNNVSDSLVRIIEGPTITVADSKCSNLVNLKDGNNVVSFTTFDDCGLGGALAVAFFQFDTTTGAITACDVTFNAQDYTWSTNPAPGQYDVQSVSNHEIMHCLGLEHSSLAGSFDDSTGLEVDGFHLGNFTKQASMFPYAPDGPAAVSLRTLQLDDMVAFRTIYPALSFAAKYGSISGKILMPDGKTGVKGAFVVAVPAGDPNTPLTGRISGLQANNAGSNAAPGGYKITGLTPGQYCVRVEPLQGTTNSFTAANTFYEGFNTSFQPEFYSGAAESSDDMNAGPGDAAVVTIVASQTIPDINIILNSPGRPSTGNTCTAGHATTAPADLALGKAAAPDSVTMGQNISYTFPITNTGPGMATSVVLTDNFPTQTSLVSANSTQGSCSPVNNTVACSIGNLAVNAVANVTIVVTPTSTGTITNTASVSSSGTDPNTSNNSASAATTVTAACFGISATASPTTVTYKPSSGRPATNTINISIKNNSSSAVTLTSITPLPGQPFTIDRTTPALPIQINHGRTKLRITTSRAAGLSTAKAISPYFKIMMSCGMLATANLLSPPEASTVEALRLVDMGTDWKGVESVQLQLFDMSGRKLVDQTSESNVLAFLAAEEGSKPLPNGIYLYVLQVRNDKSGLIQTQLRKLVVHR